MPGLGSIRIVELLDILIFATVVYGVLVLTLRGASRRGAVALAMVGFLYLFAKEWELYLTLAVFEVGFFVVLVAIAIVYQDDIRWATERIAQWVSGPHRGHSGFGDQTTRIAEDVSDVVFELAQRRIGALIVFRGTDDLHLHINGGHEIDAVPSKPLLLSLFDPASPGHDGAVVIADDRIATFGCHLPLARSNGRADERGTRHHAALGLADVSDALVIVVSEERGTVSVAKNRELRPITLPRHLESIILDQTKGFEPIKQGSAVKRFVKEKPGLKLASLAIAIIGWWLVGYDSNQIYRTFVVPIEYRNVPKDLPLGDNLVIEARVTLSGSESAFRFLAPSTLSVALDVEAITNGQRRFSIDESMVRHPGNLKVTGIEPRAVSVIPAKEASRKPIPIAAGAP